MPHTLDWPGSELRDFVVDGDTVRLRFAAASVRATDGERGWLAGVALTLAGATLQGDAAHAFGRIAEGRLLIDGRELTLTLPHTATGAIDLQLRLANGTHVALRARGLQATVADAARFTPDLSC